MENVECEDKENKMCRKFDENSFKAINEDINHLDPLSLNLFDFGERGKLGVMLYY